MADTTATLGFAIESSGLESGKQKLDQVTESAKKAEDQAKKTGDAISKVGGNTDGLKKSATAADELAASLAKLKGADAVSAVSAIEQVAAKTGVSYAQAAASVKTAYESVGKLGVAAQAAAPATQALSAGVVATGLAARASAISVAAKSASLIDLNRALRTASPLLNEFGDGLGRVFTGATRARGSVAVLAAVVGAELGIGLAKAGDAAARSKQFFDSLTGSASGGATALNAARDAAKSSGIEMGTMQSALQKAAEGQANFANKSVIYANSSDKAAKDTASLSQAFGTLNRVMENALATGKEESSVIDAVATSLQKSNTLTAESFQKIRNISLPVATEIAKIFGFKDVDAFQQRLARVPVELDEFKKKLAEVKPQVDATYNADPIKTFEQAVRSLSSAWDDFINKKGQAGGFKFASDTLRELQKSIEEINSRGFMPWLDDRTKKANEELQALGASFSQADLALSNLTKNGAAEMNSFDMAVRGMAINVAGYVTNLAQTVAGAISSMFSASRGGGGYNPNNDPFSASGTGGIQLPQGTPEDFIGAGAFASGGSFVVGGSGGTDSQTVTFKATPGETVTVATPDQAASSIASLTPVTSSTDAPDIETLLEKQTSAIVSAINSLKSSDRAASSAIVSSANSISRSVGAAVGGGYSSGGGATGGGISASMKRGPSSPQDNYSSGGRDGGSTGGYGYAGANFGQGSAAYGSSAVEYGQTTGTYGQGFSGSSSYDESGFIGGGSVFDDSYFDDSFYSGSGGSSSFDESGFAGYFAQGGRFKVGGSGGTDQTPVKFMATRGETVTITPAGMKIPSGINVSANMLRPSSGDSAGWNKPTVTHQSNKEVNIFVHDKMQAEGFLRSRAQIARAM